MIGRWTRGVGKVVVGILLAHGLGLRAQWVNPDNFFLKNEGVNGLKLNGGVMALRIAQYPGSDQSRLMPYPILFGEWQERMVFGASRFGVGGFLGIKVVKQGPWSWWIGGDGVEGIQESKVRAFAGMGDRPITLYLGSGVEYNEGPLVGVVALRKGMTPGSGVAGVLRANGYLPLGRRMVLELTALAQVVDAQEMRWEFGVTPEQAARRQALVDGGDTRISASEVGPYAPRGGVATTIFGASLGYALNEHWRLGLTINRQSVHGHAQQSPLVRRYGNVVGAFGLSYQL